MANNRRSPMRAAIAILVTTLILAVLALVILVGAANRPRAQSDSSTPVIIAGAPSPDVEPMEVENVPQAGAEELNPARRLRTPEDLFPATDIFISGTVYRSDGETPAAGARMKLQQSVPTIGEITATAGADGSYRLQPTVGGILSVVEAFTSDGYGSREVEVPHSGERIGVDIVLQKQAGIAGRVTNEKGEPVGNIDVYALSGANIFPGYGPNTNIAPHGETGHDGTYYIDNVPAAWVKVLVKTTRNPEYSPPPPQRFTLDALEVRRGVDFVLKAGVAMEGVVRDDRGAPIEGVRMTIHFKVPGVDSDIPTDFLMTGPDGRYRFGGLDPTATISMLSAWHRDYEQVHRPAILVRDSPQDFILRPLGSVTLQALARETHAPIPHYRYRLLMSFGGDQFSPHFPGGEPRGEVHNAEGKTALGELWDYQYRVEVVVLDARGTATGQSGVVEFDGNPRGSSGRVVVALVDSGRIVRGKVIREDDQSPVAGIHVALAEFQGGMGIAKPPVDSVLDSAADTTGRDGAFALRGVTPGKHDLVVSAKGTGLYPTRSYSVTVPEEGESDPLLITLAGAATVFGTVIDANGAPVSGTPIKLFPPGPYGISGMPGSAFRALATDAEGKYREEGLEPGFYSVGAHIEGVSPDEQKGVTLEAGKESEVSFDLSRLVRLSGTVTYAGGPWPRHISLNLFPATSARAGERMLQNYGDSKYKTRLEPGLWDLKLYDMRFGEQGWPLAGRFEVPAQPREQTRDIVIQAVDVDVVLDWPADKPAPRGELRLAQRFDGIVVNSSREDIVSTERHYTGVVAGEYRASYHSDDKLLTGESDWTEIGPGKDNVIVLSMAPSERIPVGRWVHYRLTNEFTTLVWNAEEVLPYLGDGPLVIELEHDSGSGGIAVQWVALKINGRQAARDARAVASLNPSQTLARFTLSAGGLRDAARLAIEASIRRDGEGDSGGTVYVVLPKRGASPRRAERLQARAVSN